MGSNRGKRYSAKFKFETVMEALTSPDHPDAQIARERNIHPAALSNWKTQFKEQGPQIFGSDQEIKQLQEEIDRLKKLLGEKEVELSMAENFLEGRSTNS